MAELNIRPDLRSASGFIELLSKSEKWQTIDDLVTVCDEVGFWESDFTRRALANAKKSKIRRIISRLTDKDGFLVSLRSQ